MPNVAEIDVNLLVEIFMGAMTTIMGILIYVKRDAFRSGNVEAKQSGRVDLNTSLITNAIAEIEKTKNDMKALSQQLVEEKIQRATLTERISNISLQLEEISGQLQSLRSDQNRRDNIWRNDVGR